MPTLEYYWKDVEVGDLAKNDGWTGQILKKIEGPPRQVVIGAITDRRASLYEWPPGAEGYTYNADLIEAVEQRYGRGRKRKTRGRKQRKHKRKTRKH